jgi:hypothetical protein
MRLFGVLLLLIVFVGCQSTKQDLKFRMASVSDGFTQIDGKTHDWYQHEWKSSDGTLIDDNLISFNSYTEAKKYFDHLDGQISKGPINYNGRKLTIETDPKSNSKTYKITLWKNHKIIRIKGPSLHYVLAFEKCCSISEFNSFR